MPDGLIIVLFTIAGGLAGAFIRYLFDQWTNAENERRSKKLALYSSFIQSLWQIFEQREKSKSDQKSYGMSILANEIILYGNEEVVRSLAPVIGRDYNETTLTNLMVAMREDILREQSAGLFEPVRTILFERAEMLPPVHTPVGTAP